MSSSEILFTNAAVQNQNFSLDDKPEKAVGILAAQALNRLHDNDLNVHCWNNVGLFDKQQVGSDGDRLADKYVSDFAQNFTGINSNRTLVLQDDQAEFSDWTLPVLDTMLASGSTYIEETDFHHCSACNITIAETAVGIEQCSSCHSSDHMRIISEPAMFTNTPSDRTLLLPDELIFNQVNMRQERSSLQQIPPRLLLSRTRNIGVSLEAFGLEDHKLDPRLGIGLLAIFAAADNNYQSVGIVQSMSTLNRVVPYLRSAIPNPAELGLPDYIFAFHCKVKPQLLHDQTVSPALLALYSLGQRNDITSTQKIASEMSKLKRCTSAITKSVPYIESDKPQQYAQRNFSGLVATTAKDIGRLLEKVKHRQTPSEETLADIKTSLNIAKHILYIAG